MALGSPVQLRLSPDQRMIYEDEAALQGKPLTTYLRERLEAQDAEKARSEALRSELANGMAELRGIVERKSSPSHEDTTGDSRHRSIHELTVVHRELLTKFNITKRAHIQRAAEVKGHVG